MSVYRPTEAGIFMIARHDIPSVLAAKGSLKYATTQGLKVIASLVPVWNIKQQSYSSVVSPFNKEIIASGVSQAFHTSAPLEGEITARKGELDIVLRFPQESLQQGRSIEAIHGFVIPYTVRRDIGALNQATDLKEILSGAPLKRVSSFAYHEFL
jgi:hypothetical protein